MDLMLVGIAVLAMAIGAGAIARSKNRSFFGYFLLGLFIPLIGLLIAIGMASRQQDPAAPKSSSGAFQWIVLIGCGLLAVYAVSGPSGCSATNYTTSASDPHSQTGCSASRRAIEARLKAPSSAKWVDCNSTTSGGVQTVTLTVDSQNALGAMLRSQWVTKVRDNKVESVTQVR